MKWNRLCIAVETSTLPLGHSSETVDRPRLSLSKQVESVFGGRMGGEV